VCLAVARVVDVVGDGDRPGVGAHYTGPARSHETQVYGEIQRLWNCRLRLCWL
jgi:hypothetical protein